MDVMDTAIATTILNQLGLTNGSQNVQEKLTRKGVDKQQKI